jgi:hypothetical protein
MESEIEPGPQTVGTMTSTKRAMVGQSPYVFNAGLTYSTRTGRASATALFNTVGRRVVAASVYPLPDIYEEARNTLDISLRLPVVASLSAKIDAKNLLDEAHEQRIGSVVRESYRTGRVFSLGFAWQQ